MLNLAGSKTAMVNIAPKNVITKPKRRGKCLLAIFVSKVRIRVLSNKVGQKVENIFVANHAKPSGETLLTLEKTMPIGRAARVPIRI